MADYPASFPDSEEMVIKCLREYLVAETVQVMGDVPKNWDDKMPVIIVTRTSGAATRQNSQQHRIDHGIFSVMVFASKKKTASLLARKASRALHQAVLDRWELAGADGGVFTAFQEIKGPVHVFDGVTGKHPDAAMYDATYSMWLRAHY